VKDILYTLKLDAAWKPIDIILADKGFIMTWAGRAKIVKLYNFGPIKNYTYPAVIVLNSYVSRRSLTISCNRKNVFWRDNYNCQYCGNKFSYGKLTMDHIIPKSKGGHKTWMNIVSACHKCNNKKGSKTLQEAKMKP
jgi:5-methylcytosine-specific restriction endonuclease McrA